MIGWTLRSVVPSGPRASNYAAAPRSFAPKTGRKRIVQQRGWSKSALPEPAPIVLRTGGSYRARNFTGKSYKGEGTICHSSWIFLSGHSIRRSHQNIRQLTV